MPEQHRLKCKVSYIWNFTFSANYIKETPGAGEMAQSVKYLLCNVSSTHEVSQVSTAEQACNPSSGHKQEDSRACWLLSLAKSLRSRLRRDSVSEHKVESNRGRHSMFALDCTCTHMCI